MSDVSDHPPIASVEGETWNGLLVMAESRVAHGIAHCARLNMIWCQVSVDGYAHGNKIDGDSLHGQAVRFFQHRRTNMHRMQRHKSRHSTVLNHLAGARVKW